MKPEVGLRCRGQLPAPAENRLGAIINFGRNYQAGVPYSILDSDRVRVNRESPGAGICWGAFSTLHQLSLGVDDNKASVFLPGVCSIRDEHGQRAIVLIKVFNHYVDEHSWDGGKQFAVVARNAFQAAWPCAVAAK
jgi:hypothetical protein